jgi:hypothetical protein
MLERILEKNLLRYAVQRAIFCQSKPCGNVLDVRGARLIDEPEGVVVVCSAKCERSIKKAIFRLRYGAKQAKPISSNAVDGEQTELGF